MLSHQPTIYRPRRRMDTNPEKPEELNSLNNLPVFYDPKLVGRELELHKSFWTVITSRSNEENDRIYDAFEDARGGTHYGTDTAKGFFHNAFNDKGANVAAAGPARAYIIDRFYRDLLAPKNSHKLIVVFTAGGPGSGKSESIKQGLVNADQSLVFDSTLTNLDRAIQLIQAALDSERGVLLAYVHRPVEGAMLFAIERAEKKGMYVSPERLGEDHWKAQINLFALEKHFRGEKDVEINVFDNRGQLKELEQIENGIAFFHDPANLSEKYDSLKSTIQRAVKADNGEIARRFEQRSRT